MQTSGIYFYMRHFCILTLFFLRLVFLPSRVCECVCVCTCACHSLFAHEHICLHLGLMRLKWYFKIFFAFFVVSLCSSHFCISGFDGLALGNQLMVSCSGWCQLCKNIWSWSKSPDSQRNMEGNIYHQFDLCLVWHINQFLQGWNGNRNGNGLIWTAAVISVPIFGLL